MFYDCDSFPTDKKGDRKDVESDPANQKPQNRWRCRTSKLKTEYCPETEDRRPLRETWADSGQEFGNVAGIIQEEEDPWAPEESGDGIKSLAEPS